MGFGLSNDERRGATESFAAAFAIARRAGLALVPHAGELLGPDAVGAAVDMFEGLAAEVLVRASPWQLGPEQAALQARWFADWLGAACEQAPELGAEAGLYARRRRADSAAGRLRVTVHHQDLWVRP